jgi:DNA-binding NtrC family response regulator
MRAQEESITALYVNDDPDLLELLQTGLEREEERLTVRTASSGAEGLAAFRDADVDCIVSDYHMPEMNGVEPLRAVREESPALPFVLFTETGDETATSEAISANVTDYTIRETIGNQHALVARKSVSHVERRRMERRAARADERLHEWPTRRTTRCGRSPRTGRRSCSSTRRTGTSSGSRSNRYGTIRRRSSTGYTGTTAIGFGWR